MSKLLNKHEAKKFYSEKIQQLTKNRYPVNSYQWDLVCKQFEETELGLTEVNLTFFANLKAVSPKAFINKRILKNQKRFLEKLPKITTIVNNKSVINSKTFVNEICSISGSNPNYLQPIRSAYRTCTGDLFSVKNQWYSTDLIEKVAFLAFIAIERIQLKSPSESKRFNSIVENLKF